MPRLAATKEEVMLKIISNTIMDRETDCALWQGYCIDKHGSIRWQGKNVFIHRLLYQWFVDPAVDVVRHTCDISNCWNLAHLLSGSTEDNIQDKVDRNRQAKGAGHGMVKLTEDNIHEIRNSNLGDRAFAAKFDVSPTTISKIRLRKIWRHIP